MNDEWETPLDLFDKLNEEFNFVYDLCTKPNGSNSRCENWVYDLKVFTESKVPEQYGNESYWMNPPYSRGNIDTCMEQAVNLFKRGKTVVCLVRFDPSTKWFQEYVDSVASEVRMLDHRVKFQGADSAYNFPCCIVVYDPKLHPALNPIALRTEYNIWGWV